MALLARTTAAAALGPRLLLRLPTLDLRLFDRFWRALLALAQQPVGGSVQRAGLGVLSGAALGLLSRLAVEEVMLAHGPGVGGDPVDQHTDRHPQADQTESRREIHHDLLRLRHRVRRVH